MAIRANKFINNEKSNHALITAITSSHKTTAFEHANQTSVFYHAHEIDKNMESNWFNYSFDGLNAWDRNRQTISFSYLKNMYDRVFYWSTREQLKLYDDGSSNPSNSIAPRAQFKVLVGRSKPWRNHLNDRDWEEFLGELEGYEIVALKNNLNKAGYGFKYAPLKPNCEKAKYCFVFSPNNKTFHNLNSIALWFKDEMKVGYSKESERTQRIQNLWKLQGLNENGNWENLVFKFDDHLIARDSRWVFSVNSEKAYAKFRFLAEDPDDFLTEIRLYAKYKKSNETRVLPFSIFLSEYDDQPNQDISLSPGPFEIAKNKIPLNTQSKRTDYFLSFLEHSISKLPIGIEMYFKNPRVVTRYELNASQYGKDSTDRMPKKWVFQGYDPQSKKWIDLHTVQNSQKWIPSEKRSFNFTNKQKYPIYRLFVNELNTNTNIIRIGELKMFN